MTCFSPYIQPLLQTSLKLCHFLFFIINSHLKGFFLFKKKRKKLNFVPSPPPSSLKHKKSFSFFHKFWRFFFKCDLLIPVASQLFSKIFRALKKDGRINFISVSVVIRLSPFVLHPKASCFLATTGLPNAMPLCFWPFYFFPFLGIFQMTSAFDFFCFSPPIIFFSLSFNFSLNSISHICSSFYFMSEIIIEIFGLL